MKLHEIKRTKSRLDDDVIEVEPAGGSYGVFKVKVTYRFEPGSFSKHASDDYTFKERHPAELDIRSITLAQNIEERDQDDKVVASYQKDDDARKLPGWDQSDEDYVLEKIKEKLDFDE